MHAFMVSMKDHWVTAVMHQFSDGTREWVGMDSMKNQGVVLKGAIPGLADLMKSVLKKDFLIESYKKCTGNLNNFYRHGLNKGAGYLLHPGSLRSSCGG